MRKFLIFLLYFLCIPSGVFSQAEYLYNYAHGLSNSLINDVLTDSDGLIWVATQDGLDRFDGKTFTKAQIPHSGINKLHLRKNGDMLIATSKGFLIHDYKTNKFKEIPFIGQGNSIFYPFVSDVTEINDVVYLTTSGYGLYTFQEGDTCPREFPSEKIFESKFLQSIDSFDSKEIFIGSYSNGCYVIENGKLKYSFKDLTDVCGFERDSLGNIYAASHKNGLFRITPVKNGYKTELILAEPVSCIFSEDNSVYIGTDGLGMKKYDALNGKISTISCKDVPFEFSKSKIHSIVSDKSGNLWAGVYQKGLLLILKKSAFFENYGYSVNPEISIGSSSIGAMALVKSDIWIATDGEGIYVIDSVGKISHFEIQDSFGKNVMCSAISMYNQDGKYMWLGTYNTGLVKIDIKTRKTLKIYTEGPGKITRMINAGENSFWYATFGDGIGKFDVNTEKFTSGIFINPSWTNSLTTDSNGNFWLATCDGLWFVDSAKTHFKRYVTYNGWLHDNNVNCVFIDSDGIVWAGTNSGVLIYNPKTEVKTYILDAVTVCSVLEDCNGFVWLSSYCGLFRYDKRSGELLSLKAVDGLIANEFSRGAGIITADGMPCFGSVLGITHIKNDDFMDSSDLGEVYISALKVNGKTINADDYSGSTKILKENIIQSNEICLQESDNNFTLSFCLSNPAKMPQTSFRYHLEGFDKEYTNIETTLSSATYTNLKSGEYIFEVTGFIGTRHTKSKQLKIIIYPHWYKTIWAKILSGILILSMMYFIFKYFREKFQRKQSERINEMKMQFFINISHEIRTPLTLIIDPLEKLLNKKNTDKETALLYKTMQINSRRILRLVTQLLDLRKIDKHQVMMKFGKTELCSFINDIVESCKPIIESKELSITQTSNNKEIYAWIDPENFEKIILNLLSNAIKFSPIGGKIDINILQENTKISVIISDNGVGLKDEDLERIFDRFYQVKSAQTRYTTGTGVGLHLAKYLTELHKGRLYAENRTDCQGSRFIIELKNGYEHLPKEDLAEPTNLLPPSPINQPQQEELSKQEEESVTNKPQKHKNQKKHLVFVIDDEEAIRLYLEKQLSEDYDVLAFENGKAAFENILKENPALIISDIMMPEMDGWTLCKKLKHDYRTNHIPIVLLTALTDEKNKTLGIEIGADMYLEKPFNTDYLLKAVKNLIANRQRVAEKIENKSENYQIEKIKLKSQDEILMQKIMQIIKEKISCRDLNVEMLADTIGVSRVHLHRKIKEMTGLTARDFLKNIRMKQATYLLTDRNLTISEIAYAVGYSNPAHFSASFKAFYGVTPMTYAQQEAQNSKSAEEKAVWEEVFGLKSKS